MTALKSSTFFSIKRRDASSDRANASTSSSIAAALLLLPSSLAGFVALHLQVRLPANRLL